MNKIKMGSKTDGFYCDHVKSKCCNDRVRFITTGISYSIQVWCEKCGNYIFNGRIETFIALWMGDFVAIEKNKGYLPEWLEENTGLIKLILKVNKIMRNPTLQNNLTEEEKELFKKILGE